MNEQTYCPTCGFPIIEGPPGVFVPYVQPAKALQLSFRIADLEAAGRALLEWDSRSWTGTSYGFNERMKGRDELKEIIRRFRVLLEPTEPDEERWKHPPCMECGAMTAKEAETKCHCGGDKDSCHGSELWPEE